jgi:LCP family protein required for cell wall assembly
MNARLKRFFPYIFLAVMIVFSAFCGVVATRMVQTKQNVADSFFSFFVPPPQQYFGKDRIYVMLLGIDYNYDNKDNEFSAGARSDTIMVAGLDLRSKSVKIISVPRDMGAVVNGHEDKINAAYATGGPKYTDEVVGSWLGLAKNEHGTYFDRYIVLRIDATKELVDAIGGIEVPVTETLNYDDSWGHLHIHFKPGLQHMNGDQAVSYSRFRHDACSDPCRIKRQQQILQITIAKLKSDKINDIAHIGALIGVINRNVITNLTADEEKSLAWAFRDANLADIKAGQIEYVDTKQTAGGEVLIPNETQKANLVAAFTGPYANVTPPPAAVVAAVAPSSVHVTVQNGSGESGLGAKMAQALRKRGFVVDSVGNADAFTYDTTVIREHSKVPGVGERVRRDLALKTATVSPLPQASAPVTSETGDVTVVVGRDFALLQAVPGKTAIAQ